MKTNINTILDEYDIKYTTETNNINNELNVPILTEIKSLDKCKLNLDIFKIMELKYNFPKEFDIKYIYPFYYKRPTLSCLKYIFENYNLINYENILFDILKYPFYVIYEEEYIKDIILYILKSSYKDKLNLTTRRYGNSHVTDKSIASFLEYIIDPLNNAYDGCLYNGSTEEDAEEIDKERMIFNHLTISVINENLIPNIDLKETIEFAAKADNEEIVIFILQKLDDLSFINKSIISDNLWISEPILTEIFLKYHNTKLKHLVPLTIFTHKYMTTENYSDDFCNCYFRNINVEILKYVKLSKDNIIEIIKHKHKDCLEFILKNELYDFKNNEIKIVVD